MSVNYKQSCSVSDCVDKATSLTSSSGYGEVFHLVALVWTKGGNQWLSSCAAAPKPLPVKPACNNQRVNPPYPWLKAADRWHTEIPVLYTDINTSLHTHPHIHKKPSSPQGWRVRQAIKGMEQMPTCSPWTWPCLGYARVPRVAPGCLNTLFPSVAWKVKGRDVQVHGYYPPPPLSLSVSPPSLSLPSLLHPPTNPLWEENCTLL